MWNLNNFLVSTLWIGVPVLILYYIHSITRVIYFCATELKHIIVPLFSTDENHDTFVNKMIRFFEYCHPMKKVWFVSGLHVIISDPENVSIVLKKNLEKSTMYDCFKAAVGNSLLTAPADLWKLHRKFINPAFNQSVLNSSLDMLVKQSKKLVKYLHGYNNIEIDVFPEVSRCTFAMICEYLTGLDDADPQELDECMSWISKGQKIVGEHVYNPLYHYDFFWKYFGRAKEEHEVVASGLNYIDKMMKKVDMRETREDSKKLLHILKKIFEQKQYSSYEEVLMEVQDTIIGGSDTTAITNSNVILMLAIHQDMQKKVYEELFEIFGNSDRDATLEDLGKMKYLDCVIKETLRLFPPGPIIFRKTERDTILANRETIRKGTNVVIPIVYMHRNPIYWPNPLKFEPDRFLPEEIIKRPRYAFMPFSISPRNCIGVKYAEMSMKVTLSIILRNFQLYTKYNSVESIDLSMHVFLTVTNGWNVTLVSRLKQYS